jgi:hypothetical protein
VDRATTFVTETIAKPVRQLNSILASAKSVLESIRPHMPEPPQQQPPPPVSTYDPEDKDMFL